MSDGPWDDADCDPEEELDEMLQEEPVTPPAEMKLSIEVGLSEYSPQGLLSLLARGLLAQIGGKDKWAKRLEGELLKQGKARAESIVDHVVTKMFEDNEEGVDFTEIVSKAASEYMNERVDSDGKVAGGFNRSERPTRLAWIVSKLTREAMDAAFKQAETEWRAQTTQAIKETLAGALADRLAKALPAPPELR